jgi:hypothetical protein
MRREGEAAAGRVAVALAGEAAAPARRDGLMLLPPPRPPPPAAAAATTTLAAASSCGSLTCCCFFLAAPAAAAAAASRRRRCCSCSCSCSSRCRLNAARLRAKRSAAVVAGEAGDGWPPPLMALWPREGEASLGSAPLAAVGNAYGSEAAAAAAGARPRDDGDRGCWAARLREGDLGCCCFSCEAPAAGRRFLGDAERERERDCDLAGEVVVAAGAAFATPPLPPADREGDLCCSSTAGAARLLRRTNVRGGS